MPGETLSDADLSVQEEMLRVMKSAVDRLGAEMK